MSTPRRGKRKISEMVTQSDEDGDIPVASDEDDDEVSTPKKKAKRQATPSASPDDETGQLRSVNYRLQQLLQNVRSKARSQDNNGVGTRSTENLGPKLYRDSSKVTPVPKPSTPQRTGRISGSQVGQLASPKPRLPVTPKRPPRQAPKPKRSPTATTTTTTTTTSAVLIDPQDRMATATDPGSRYGNLNQDASFTEALNVDGTLIYLAGVFDGHGKHGEHAANTAAEIFQRELKEYFTEEWAESKPDSLKHYEALLTRIYDSVHDEIVALYKDLPTLEWDNHSFAVKQTKDGVDFYYSNTCSYVLLQDFGTTAVVCIYFPETKTLIMSNCGDSEAIVGRVVKKTDILHVEGAAASEGSSTQWEPLTLTVSDNISNNQADVDRILKEFKNTKIQNGYLSPNSDLYGFHSLAMTRALGHKFLQRYGIQHTPHVSKFKLEADDKLLVLGSDGLFDVVSRQDVFVVAGTNESLQSRCNDLVGAALESWEDRYPIETEEEGEDGKKKVTSDSADNITVVLVDLTK